MIEENRSESVSQVRPWVRYFARSIDMILFGTIIGFIRLFIDPSVNYNSSGIGFVILIIWIFIEARMISHSGCTPGKKLLKTKVIDEYNNRLTFAQALKRSFLVWLMGMGLGIFSLITMIIGFFELRKEKTTTWDKRCKSNVIHEKIGVLRVVVAVIIYIVFFVLVLGASQAGML